jgi:hypothetical protein
VQDLNLRPLVPNEVRYQTALHSATTQRPAKTGTHPRIKSGAGFVGIVF